MKDYISIVNAGTWSLVHSTHGKQETSNKWYPPHAICLMYGSHIVCRKKYSLINAWSLLRKLSIHNFQRFHELGIHWTCLKGDRPASEDHDPIQFIRARIFLCLKCFSSFFFFEHWLQEPAVTLHSKMMSKQRTYTQFIMIIKTNPP